MRKLDFVVAGVQKGGTTALWHFLRQHPEIGMSDSKELHFFDNESIDWARPDYGLLHGHFAEIADRRVIGEATPIYTYWPQCLERIRQYNPEIKLIVSLRDPVARAWSHWRMETARALDDVEFSYAIREGRLRVTNDPSGHHRVYSYVERGFYADQVEKLYSLFPREQVKIIRQSDLLTDHRRTLSDITTFLGVGRMPDGVEPETVFSHDDGKSPHDDDIRFLRRLYLEDEQRVLELTGIDLPLEYAPASKLKRLIAPWL